ncbi:MAG: ABC transporter permease subunit, partial [Clostridia bacterium]|nr:ABC transporter permease subunit [Clostridia bacterium]
MHRRTKETLIKTSFQATAVTSLAVLALIMVFLFMEGLPTFSFVSVKHFLLGLEWYPTDEARPDYGILPLLTASFAVTAVSSVIAIPLGVMSAVYLSEIASPRVRAVAKPVIEMLASLPSVVIGFFGMVVMAPFLQDYFGVTVGLNLFNAALMLAFMSVPTIASVSEDAIYAVP